MREGVGEGHRGQPDIVTLVVFLSECGSQKEAAPIVAFRTGRAPSPSCPVKGRPTSFTSRRRRRFVLGSATDFRIHRHTLWRVGYPLD